jgi:hypothetical protein
MKIKVISNRRPWIDGKPREMGWEGEVAAADADAMIANGLVEKKMGRPAKKDDADDLDD